MDDKKKEKAIQRVAAFVDFAHAERMGDSLSANDARAKLARLGVVIKPEVHATRKEVSYVK